MAITRVRVAVAVLLALAFLASALPVRAQTLYPNRGGTGTTTAPAYGEVLVGQQNGTYGPMSTSSLNIDADLSNKTTSDLAEGSNLYYTLARVQAALIGGYNAIFGNATTTNATTTNLAVTGSFNFLGTIITDVSAWFNGLFDTRLATKTTTDVAEGSNLYWTPNRFAAALAGTTTDALAEGSSNQYWTLARFAGALAGTTTDALAQGATNRYYSDALARAAISATSPLSYSSATGVISISTNGDWSGTLDGYEASALLSRANHTGSQVAATISDFAPTVASLIAGTTTDALAEGSTNLYFTDARARSAVSAGSGLSYSSGTGVFSLDATGDWTGTFDGQEGSYYRARANHTGTQLASTISDFATTARGLFSSLATGLTYNSTTGEFSLTSGFTIPLTASTSEWAQAYGWGNHANAGYFVKATDDTDDITEGAGNLYFTNARADARIDAQKGVADGLATLDGGGKVPVSQLPNSIMQYQGTWNATTNSPTLADGSGSTGDVYRVSVAGSQDLGSGTISFVVGDYAIYNGTTWEKADTTDAVSSVNGLTGDVTLTTTNVAEGSNLYYTDARVGSYITGSSTLPAHLNYWTLSGSNVYRASGNVGIGTTNPQAALTVGGNQAGNAGMEIIPGSGIVLQSYNRTGGVYASISYDGSSMNFRPNGTSKLFVDATGAGVATTSLSARFAVTGAGTGTGRLVTFADSTNVERFTGLDNGYFGIGTTSPYARLSIAHSGSTNSANILRIERSDLARGITFGTNGTKLLMDSSSTTELNWLGDANGLFLFSNSYATDTSKAARLGIPAYDGVGRFLFGLMSSTAGANNLQLGGGSALGYAATQIRFYGATTTNATTGNIIGIANGDGAWTIGTDLTPEYHLEIEGSTGSGYFGVTNAIDGDVFVVNSSGNVGIGDASPDAKLDILQASDTSTQGLQISRSNDTDYTRLYKSSSLGTLSDPLIFNTNFGDVAAIGRDGSGYFAGNVGIGTTPATTLHLTNNSAAVDIIRVAGLTGQADFANAQKGISLLGASMNAGAAKYAPMLAFGSTDPQFTTTNPKLLAAVAGYATQTYGADDDSGMGLEFFTTPDDAGVTPTPLSRMVIDQNGNVGVGTTSPAKKFSVAGDALISGTTTASCFTIDGVSCLSAGGTPGGSDGQVQFNDGGSFGAESGFTYTKTAGQLSVPGNGWYSIGGGLLAYASSSNDSTIFGLNAGGNATTSTGAIGNTAVGARSLRALNAGGFFSGDWNTAVGVNSLTNLTTAHSNTAVGFQASHSNITGNGNVAIGSSALYTATSSADNIAIGYQAGANMANNGNVAIGSGAGAGVTYGSYNIAMGYNAGNSSAITGSNNILIGAWVAPPSLTGSQQVNIGNVLFGSNIYNGFSNSSAPTLNGTIGIGSTTPGARLAVHAPAGSTLSNLLMVGSSTASATTTHAVIRNTGQTFLYNLTSSATGNAICITTSKELTDAGGGTCTPSSIRFKENVTDLAGGHALSILERLRVVSFDYKPDAANGEDPQAYGLIAEEVEAIDTRLVDYGADGSVFSLHFERITGLLVQAVQELAANDNDQNDRLDRLEARIEALERENTGLRAGACVLTSYR